ncbi:MAG: ATP-binding cassette domain-containing protein, partial [Planctomycetota bacterium]|nr:ATP-binding cassette domain-containing protein [Planctomycetota bacterium]
MIDRASGNPVIEAVGLRKTFRGGVNALNGLDLRVDRGSVYAFLGRNGSGKTTGLRILLGLLEADEGSARVLGRGLMRAP